MPKKVIPFTIAIPVFRRSVGLNGRLFLLSCGLCLAAIAFVFFTPGIATSPLDNNPQPLNEELVRGTVTVVTANTKITKGSKIFQQYLREASWPRDQVPEGAIRKTEDVVNMYALTSLRENQPILRNSISTTPSFDSLPPENRAVTINMDNIVRTFDPWVAAGEHVDVLLTYLDPKDSTKKTRVVVEDAVVLAFRGGTKAPQGMEANSGTTGVDTIQVTLSVPLQDSMKIQSAIALGRITLAYRNPNDNSRPTTSTVAE